MQNKKFMTISILSLSLLTVMAGAAVAPALNVIQSYFADVDTAVVRMIISMPALFIFLTNLIFPALCKRFKCRTLVLTGLALYTVGGCMAGAFDNIYAVLAFCALVGVGVGIIMPLSTGLLSFYYTREEQDGLMGYSSAMNQMGGVVATLISGFLAGISWRASFLVYLMGLIAVVLCALFLPNEYIVSDHEDAPAEKEGGVFKRYYMYIIGMFLLMFTFFVYPSCFAMETAKEGIIPLGLVTVIMAGMDFIAFLGGLSFVKVKQAFGTKAKLVHPVLFLAGYVLMFVCGGWIGAIFGSACIGFANGVGVPFLMSAAGQKAGKSAATTVMPMMSMALYLSQFVTPMVIAAIGAAPYLIAVCTAVVMVLWTVTMKD